jgi:hypothetical protein
LGFDHFLSQINQSITHPAKGGIDAHACFICNFLKAHIHVVPHNEHLLLFRRQLLDKVPEAGLRILGNLKGFR